MAGKLTLILGGARSGKSDLAELRAAAHGGEILFVATAVAMDDEMEARIANHKASRPSHWKTLEAARDIAGAIQDHDGDPDVILIDCITLLASNVYSSGAREDPAARETGAAALRKEVEKLLETQAKSHADWIVVSNEVGMGLVPPYPLGRVYRDALGRVNQQLAQAADEVLFMVAGLPVVLKAIQ